MFTVIAENKNKMKSPSTPLAEGPGVYAICVTPNRINGNKVAIADYVVYIGSSASIRKRVMNNNHVYRRLINLLETWITYTMFLPCDEYCDLERRLIRKYRPRFNRHLYKNG